MSTFRLVAIGLVFAAFASRVAAQELHFVPQELPTIQAAVDVCLPGDTILVSAGTYAEAVVVTGASGLLIQGKGKVVIDPPDDSDALVLVGCTDVTVKRVRAAGAVNGFTLTGCTGGALLKCHAQDLTGSGIVLDDCSGVTVDKCTIEDAAVDGIALGATELLPSFACLVSRNRVYRTGDEGVHVSADDTVVLHNLIVESTGDGIRLETEPPSARNVVDRNKVVRSGGQGIVVQGEDHELHENTVLESTDTGVRAREATNCILEECRVVRCATSGIVVTDGSSLVYVLESVVKDAGENGIEVGSNEAVVGGSRCLGAGHDGYLIAGHYGAYTANIAKGSMSNGFEILGGSNTLMLNIGKCSTDGFDLNDPSIGTNSIDASNHFGTVAP